jgi:DNA polymerase elongation subunit (family B)
MQTGLFFPYTWHLDDEQTEVTHIRAYGLDENNKNVCLRVDDFTPYVYIELPLQVQPSNKQIEWNAAKAQLVGNKINEILKHQKPVSMKLMMKKKLYGAYFDENKKRKLFPYLFCNFYSKHDIRKLYYMTQKSIHVVGLGAIKIKVHESDADPILQFTCCRNIPTAGWIKYGGKQVSDEDSITLCDHEIKVSWKNVMPFDKDNVPQPKIMGFDIEVNSTNPTAMPKAEKPGDKVFQISCVLARDGDNPDDYEKYLLTLGEPDEETVGLDTLIYMFDTEAALLQGFTDFIRDENPNIIVGYNILGFDIPYMIARAKHNMCIFTFDRQGFHKTQHAKERTIKWSSSAYKNQEFEFLDAEGRLYVDLLPLVKRDFKFNNYKLKTISEYFIGQTKDPLSVQGIFKCYRIGIKKNAEGEYSPKARKAMAIVGKYCVQDSALVVHLMDKLKTWVGLTEMAKTCNTSIFSLYTQGQQIKVFSQLYKYCMYEDIVVEKDAYKVTESERYVGAKVFPPIPGRYKMVVPFDFASLYPTTIIAYNIDYHTWVPPDSNIPDELCHVMEWEDHLGCCHDPKVIRKGELNNYITQEQARIKKLREKRNGTLDKLRKKEMMTEITAAVDALKPYTEERSELTKTIAKNPMCAKRKYRFLKKPRGVLPTIIQNLLDARKHTRKVVMKSCFKEIDRLKAEAGPDMDKLIKEQKSLIDVLDKRQLSYKVSANSMYGAMGVRKGYLPFMPGAMCTTYMGRVNIELVAETIPKKYGGELVYGDTDSNYIHFPHLTGAQETWDYALHVASEVTKLFPAPIELEFEEEIYKFFFILSKKRYMYRKCLRDGVTDNKIGKKGVLLARRDNSKFVRDVYEDVVTKIADYKSCDEIVYYVLTELNALCSGIKPYTDFVITKAVGDSGGLYAEAFENEKGVRKAKVGDYTVPLLSSNKDEREDQLSKKGADDSQEYYLLCLPAQVQLAERMRRRGQRVDPGTRLEYVVADPTNHTGKQYEKVESAEYLVKHSDLVKIDYLYYLKALVNPLDQVLDVAFGEDKKYKKGMVMDQYKFRWKIRAKLLEELKDLFRPKLKFEK